MTFTSSCMARRSLSLATLHSSSEAVASGCVAKLPPHSIALGKWSRRVQDAQAGDATALSALVTDLAPGVLRALTALLGRDYADLEDVAQEVLLEVIDALPRFRGECTLLHFAVRIAARKSVTVRRRGSAVRSWLEQIWRREEPLQVTPIQGHDGALASARRALLQALLQELPIAQSESLLLRVVFGYSIEEIASLTHAPLNTVRSRLRLAKLALRERISTNPEWLELAGACS